MNSRLVIAILASPSVEVFFSRSKIGSGFNAAGQSNIFVVQYKAGAGDGIVVVWGGAPPAIENNLGVLSFSPLHSGKPQASPSILVFSAKWFRRK
jgi:hypothetical protein